MNVVIPTIGTRGDVQPYIALALGLVKAGHTATLATHPCMRGLVESFGGMGDDAWTWLLCDSPTLLYALLAMGLGDDPRVQAAVAHLISLVGEYGWGCKGSPELGIVNSANGLGFFLPTSSLLFLFLNTFGSVPWCLLVARDLFKIAQTAPQPA